MKRRQTTLSWRAKGFPLWPHTVGKQLNYTGDDKACDKCGMLQCDGHKSEPSAEFTPRVLTPEDVKVGALVKMDLELLKKRRAGFYPSWGEVHKVTEVYDDGPEHGLTVSVQTGRSLYITKRRMGQGEWILVKPAP